MSEEVGRMNNLQKNLGGDTLLALQLVGFTEEEWRLLDCVARALQGYTTYAVVWHNRRAPTLGKHFYILAGEHYKGDYVGTAKRRLGRKFAAKSEHWLLVLLNGRVPFGAEIKPEWRETTCSSI